MRHCAGIAATSASVVEPEFVDLAGIELGKARADVFQQDP
jgi:hypothetical protein